MRDLVDEELLALVARANSDAFDELYGRYGERLMRYFKRMLGPEKAADFLQELFIKVIEHADRLQPGARFSTWCFTLAHNLCCNEYRFMSVRRDTVPADMDQLGSCSAASAERRLDQEAFQRALYSELSQLDQKRRSTFLLRFQEEFALADIARIMDCSVGTVKSRLFYTVRWLAKRLQAFDPCLDEGSYHE